jgi:hypothetical protein
MARDLLVLMVVIGVIYGLIIVQCPRVAGKIEGRRQVRTSYSSSGWLVG